MYAVILTGGKQYKVEEGDLLSLEKLDGEVGSKVELPVAFIADGDKVIIEAAKLSKAKVIAEIVEQYKGNKVVIFKFKKRKGYKRKKGHRQELTKVKIQKIQKTSRAKTADKEPVLDVEPVEAPLPESAVITDIKTETETATA